MGNRLDDIRGFVNRDTEKCPLPVFTGVRSSRRLIRIKRVNFREYLAALGRDKRKCP